MQIKLILVLLLVGYSFATIGSTNNEDADTPEDVAAFRAMHSNNDHVLFFHDGADQQETGFFESLFGIFGNSGNQDEEFQKELAKKYPTLEIDKNKASLKQVPDDYKVSKLPYVIAYHKGREIWRGEPTNDTSGVIARKIKEYDDANTVPPRREFVEERVIPVPMPEPDIARRNIIPETNIAPVVRPSREVVVEPVRAPTHEVRTAPRQDVRRERYSDIIDPFDDPTNFSKMGPLPPHGLTTTIIGEEYLPPRLIGEEVLPARIVAEEDFIERPRGRIAPVAAPVRSVVEPRIKGEYVAQPKVRVAEIPAVRTVEAPRGVQTTRVVSTESAPVVRGGQWVEGTPTNRNIVRPTQGAQSTRISGGNPVITSNTKTTSTNASVIPSKTISAAESQNGITVRRFDGDNRK